MTVTKETIDKYKDALVKLADDKGDFNIMPLLIGAGAGLGLGVGGALVHRGMNAAAATKAVDTAVNPYMQVMQKLTKLNQDIKGSNEIGQQAKLNMVGEPFREGLVGIDKNVGVLREEFKRDLRSLRNNIERGFLTRDTAQKYLEEAQSIRDELGAIGPIAGEPGLKVELDDTINKLVDFVGKNLSPIASPPIRQASELAFEMYKEAVDKGDALKAGIMLTLGAGAGFGGSQLYEKHRKKIELENALRATLPTSLEPEKADYIIDNLEF